jgi:hypothetical protein
VFYLTVHFIAVVAFREQHATIEGALDDVSRGLAHHGCLEGSVEIARADVGRGIDRLGDAIGDAQGRFLDGVHVDPCVAAESDAFETEAAVHE